MGGGGKIERCVVLWSGGEGGGGLKVKLSLVTLKSWRRGLS